MINEGRGISEVNKIETENIFNIFKVNGFSTFEHQILNKIIEITFELGNYNSRFYKKSGRNHIVITCPKIYDDLKLKSILTHELTNFIKEVIEDINEMNNYSTYYPISESTILSYNEYIKENLKNND